MSAADPDPAAAEPMSDSGDEELPADGAGGLPAAQRQSTRRKPHVDISRLNEQSLRKYRRVFKLGDPQTFGSKEEMLPAVLRHWQQTMVEEDETLLAFAFALRKQATGQASPMGAGALGKAKPKPGFGGGVGGKGKYK